MRNSTRFPILFLLIAFLISASGWAFDRAILEDMVHESQRITASIDIPDSIDLGADAAAQAHATPCNHGCHLLTHFQGEVIQGFSLGLAPRPSEAFTEPLSTFPLPAPGTQLRPPRLLARI